MKIVSINIPKSVSIHKGLGDIKMDKIGDLVLLAGKNGAGKTRILQIIKEMISSKPKEMELSMNSESINSIKNSISIFTVELENAKKTNNQSSIDYFEEQIKEYTYQIKKLMQSIDWKYIITDSIEEEYSFISFTPDKYELKDYLKLTSKQILEYGKDSTYSMEDVSEKTLARIKYIQDRDFNSTHPSISLKFSDAEIESAKSNYLNLKNTIETFLDTELGRTIDGEITLFGFPAGNANLSKGQIALLQYCLKIYPKFSDGSGIIYLDEPENYIHPKMLIEVIERLKQRFSKGQIWIATHSIPLLAHFDPSNIWFVENGTVKYGGKTPEKILESLIGDENEVSKLQDFIGLPAQFAINRYAFESLFEPAIVFTESSDPQSNQIYTEIKKLSSQGNLKILDYGAGKGRLISNINDLDKDTQERLINRIDYVAFDKFPNEKEHCENILVKIYGTSSKRYYSDFPNLFSHHDKNSFDIVIMCNVLHEIDPKDWITLFRESGYITECLKEDGYLLLVEDTLIPVGEKAYQKGFLVLDTAELKDLFKITSANSFYFNEKLEGRLKAHLIPRKFLKNIDSNSREKAIKSISVKAKDKILDLRTKERNYKNGRLHAFWTQQLANAELNLSELG